MVGEASAFCVHPSGLFVTNHHAIRNVLPPAVSAAITQPPAPGGRTRPTSPAPDHIPIAITPEAKPRIDLILNSNRADQKILPARVLWTDPDWDLALLRAEGTGDLPALPIAPESALAGLGEVVAFGFPLGQALAVQAHYPAVNVTRGKVLQVAATDGQPGEIVAQLSISPGNSGGPLLDKRGLVVGVIRARLENRASGKGVSMAIPVNRLERFLSRPEITSFGPPIVDRAAAGQPVEFRAELKTLFPPREPVELELTMRDAGGRERRFPMIRSGMTYRAVAVPFPVPEARPGVSLTVMRAPDPSIGRVKEESLSRARAGQPGQEFFPLSSIRRVRLRPAFELEGVFSRFQRPARFERINGPFRGLDKLLADLEQQVPNFDPEEVEEIEVEPAANGESLLIAWQAGTIVARVECDDRDLKCGSQTFRLSNARRLQIGKHPRAELAHDERLVGPIEGVEGLLRELRRRAPEIDPKAVTRIVVDAAVAPAGEIDELRCTLVARRAGTIVARHESGVYARTAEGPTLESLSQGRFIRPRRSIAPVTMLRLRTPRADRLGQCEYKPLTDDFRRCLIGDPAGGTGRETNLVFEGDQHLVESASTASLVIGHRYTPWKVDIRPPRGQAFQTGEYSISADEPPGSLNCSTAFGCSPAEWRTFRPNVLASRAGEPGAPDMVHYSGRVRIWELETRGPVHRLAIDFVLSYKASAGKGGAGGERLLVGMYRWRSTFD
jgi:hypothetical protein